MQHIYYQRHLRANIDYAEKLINEHENKNNSLMVEVLKQSRIYLLDELQRYQIAVFKR